MGLSCGVAQRQGAVRLSRAIVVATCLVSLLLACGGHEVVRPTVVNVSIGQQLIDLQRARDAGALSAREYESQRRTLIDRVE